MKDYLSDQEFLLQLDRYPVQTKYVKIISLNKNEQPIEEITGKATGGSVSVDGTSAMRTTCSLTLVPFNTEITSIYWGLSNKFKLSIGLKNNINPNYPDIIWFEQGTFVITSFSISKAPNNKTISIQGKDKMCLLNGELGGTFKEQTKLNYEKLSDGREIERPIYDIICDAVHQFGGEPMSNIVISDLPPYGLEMLEFRSHDQEMFQLKANGQSDDKYDTAITFDGTMQCKLHPNDVNTITLSKACEMANPITVYPPTTSTTDFTLTKIRSGDNVGYKKTMLTYPQVLMAAPGETVVTILDKIIQMLGDFEYFYNAKGQFIFQRKKIYLKNITETIQDEPLIALTDLSTIAYRFDNTEILTQLNINPQISNVKNDFTIHGTRKSVSGVEIPIRARYAVQTRPIVYRSLMEGSNSLYCTQEYSGSSEGFTKIIVDYREILYQMAQDYLQLTHDEQGKFDLVPYQQKLREAHKNILNAQNIPYYNDGKTGYERYYIQVASFWRTLYEENQGVFDWKDIVKTNPEQLDYWIELIQPTSPELEKYSIDAIGERPKVINNNKIKAIKYRPVSNTVYYNADQIEELKKESFPGYSFVQIDPNTEKLFVTSTKGRSTEEVFEQELYSTIFLQSAITLTSIPIYHLQPNTKIIVADKESGLNGEYLITRLNYSLAANGTLSIQTIQPSKRIY